MFWAGEVRCCLILARPKRIAKGALPRRNTSNAVGHGWKVAWNLPSLPDAFAHVEKTFALVKLFCRLLGKCKLKTKWLLLLSFLKSLLFLIEYRRQGHVIRLFWICNARMNNLQNPKYTQGFYQTLARELWWEEVMRGGGGGGSTSWCQLTLPPSPPTPHPLIPHTHIWNSAWGKVVNVGPI